MRPPSFGCKPITRSLAIATLALAALSTARADYPALVQSDNPKAYYRLNDSTARSLINKNSGTLGAAGDATNDLSAFGIVHPFPGAIVGDRDRSEFFDFTTRTEIPFNPALNTPNTQPFTVEAWMYPASDQTATGMGALANRWTQGGARQGWVMYQRKPDSTYAGSEPVGWEFRMYNGVGGNSPMDVTSLAPYQVGKWQHVVVVYDPVDAMNATLTIYIDGVETNSQIYSGTDPGYAPCTGDHSPAPNGQPAMSIGNYNNANSGTFGAANPWFGAVDEYAWYPSKLTPAQILAHYQNGTNANRSTPYDTLIRSHNPAAYLRLNEIAPSPDLAVNLGDSRASGIGTNTPGVRHPATGALAGRTDSGAFGYHWRDGGGTTTQLPWTAANNPDASVPFTFEGWFRPTADRMNPGPSPVNNRYVNPNPGANTSGSVGKNRTGWVIYQRNPSPAYSSISGESAVGWAFRMYSGSGTGGQDAVTSIPYNVGDWTHFVVTWEPQTDISPAANGGVAWQGTLTAYVNGAAAASNPSATYAANTNPSDDGTTPSDFAVGSYNAASGFGEEMEGNIGEVAFYNNIVLTPDQILAHYQAATNSNYGTNYETLVFTAGFTGPERAGLPKTYLRFNDPPYYSAANSGSLGRLADGNLVLTTNIAAGPRTPTYPGFDSVNIALPLDGLKQWASFNNPSGLNISGQITLETWVKPGASQGTTARIISHGPQTASLFLSQAPDGAITNTTEVFLRLNAAGTDYAVGSATYDDATTTTTTHGATFPVPAGDLGSSSWIHLVGTYDGANWRLYRNGVLVATQADAVGALAVDDADWAIGSTGNGWADPFAGEIDEVAIYGTALSASQVANHYKAGTLIPRLTIVRSGASNITITWPYGTLYQADNVTGPWTPVPGNPTSPYTTSASAAKKFYRF